MGSHSVTCHLAEVTFLPLPQAKLVLDLATLEGCNAELTYVTEEQVVESWNLVHRHECIVYVLKMVSAEMSDVFLACCIFSCWSLWLLSVFILIPTEVEVMNYWVSNNWTDTAMIIWYNVSALLNGNLWNSYAALYTSLQLLLCVHDVQNFIRCYLCLFCFCYTSAEWSLIYFLQLCK